jgi:tRNA(fMet)-specific endonuclease VapC
MKPEPALLDTDVLSAILKQQPKAVSCAQTYLAAHHRLTFSLITRYEVLRGLQARRAVAQLAAFDRFCAQSAILPLTDDIVSRAAAIYGDLHRAGALIGDADILIAASALVHGFVLITNNEEHFRRVAGLRCENWLR